MQNTVKTKYNTASCEALSWGKCPQKINYNETLYFVVQLVQRFCIDDKHGSQISEADFYSTIETLSRIATHSRQAPEGYVILWTDYSLTALLNFVVVLNTW